jgi:hypothetical protein
VLYSLCPWAHMSGPSTFVHAPFSYKRGGMRHYKWTQLRLTQTLTSSYKLTSNTSHSGVGCYAPATRTTLNPCVLVFFPFSRLTRETPRPLLILGFRAGALRHPAGDFLSDSNDEFLCCVSLRCIQNILNLFCGLAFYLLHVICPLFM